jgi:DNA repair protein RAD16
LLNNYAHIFDLLTKMRQAVDHPYLIIHSVKNHAATSSASARQNTPAIANGSTECEICEEVPTDRVVSSCCGSAYCRSCVLDMMSMENMQNNDSVLCRSCRAPFSIDLNQENQQVVDDSTLTMSSSDKAGMPSLKDMSHVPSKSILRRLNLAEYATSTKIEALVQELVQMRQERPGSKAIVFSQFVNMLDLVRWRLHSDPCLQDLGLGVRIIHGGKINGRFLTHNDVLKKSRSQ